MYSLLIVEDEYLVRQGIRSLVDFDQFQIKEIGEAKDGIEAWAYVQDHQPDIVLTDINMPRMNGIHLAQLIKETYPQTHLVFLTGYDEFDYALSALKLGADDYLLKPFSKADIEEMLTKVMKGLRKEEKEEQVQQLMSQQEQSSLEQAIQERLGDVDLTLKSLGNQLGFSPNYLSVLIKKELGISFQNYLVQERIKKAKLLLLTTDLKIYEIAEQVGFEDINYFSQRFKQVEGITPRQFKKGDKG